VLTKIKVNTLHGKKSRGKKSRGKKSRGKKSRGKNYVIGT